MAGSDSRRLCRKYCFRFEAGAFTASDALLSRSAALGVDTHVLVPAIGGVVLRHAEFAYRASEPLLSGLSGGGRCREQCRDRCRCAGSRVEGHGQSFGDEDHHAVVRQTNDGCIGEALVRHLHAAQLIESGDLLPGGLSRADTLDGMQC